MIQHEFRHKEIAYQLGFEDDKYFSRLFKKVVGLPQGIFRDHQQAAGLS
jgi:YesN/AraC family two-component response regulator